MVKTSVCYSAFQISFSSSHPSTRQYIFFVVLAWIFNNPILCQFWKTKRETIFFLELLLGWTDYLNWNPRQIMKCLKPLHANIPVLVRDPRGPLEPTGTLGTHSKPLGSPGPSGTLWPPFNFQDPAEPLGTPSISLELPLDYPETTSIPRDVRRENHFSGVIIIKFFIFKKLQFLTYKDFSILIVCS